MLLDNILDGALMYDITDSSNRNISSHKKDDEELSNVDEENAQGLHIKYTNSTLRSLFKTIIQQQSMIDRIGVTFSGMAEVGNSEQELDFSIETMKSVYIRNTCFKIVNNKLIEQELAH